MNLYVKALTRAAVARLLVGLGVGGTLALSYPVAAFWWACAAGLLGVVLFTGLVSFWLGAVIFWSFRQIKESFNARNF